MLREAESLVAGSTALTQEWLRAGNRLGSLRNITICLLLSGIASAQNSVSHDRETIRQLVCR
jgi:hypothetical protein